VNSAQRESKKIAYHAGRFKTLLGVVNHYNTRFSLGLTTQEKTDLVGYLKSQPSAEEAQ
jgi:cytochrome c peroxidase